MKWIDKKPKIEYDDQELFMRNHRKHHHQVALFRILIFIFFIAIWEISANQQWIDAFFFSSPSTNIQLPILYQIMMATEISSL